MRFCTQDCIDISNRRRQVIVNHNIIVFFRKTDFPFCLCHTLLHHFFCLSATTNVPVIMLTAKGDNMDKILGLEYGADDYITKPFNILEVKARIKAILRRMEPKKTSAESGGILESGDLKLDRDGRRAYIQRREIGLTAKEFEVLELLMLNPDKVYSRENLLKLVWGTDYPGDVRTVDVHIRRLREKIELSPSEPRYVHTKWGVGYYFNDKLSHGQNA